MVHIYYHIYVIEGIEEIIDEQISLIEKSFDFTYNLNIGISIAEDNKSISDLFKKFNNIRDVRANGNEFVTLDLIEKDKEKFGDSDYILYLHTKGASKLNNINYFNIKSWRELMNYFNIEKCKDVLKLFEKTDFNTYGVLFNKFYMGNFWWAKSSYLKTLNMSEVDKNNRYHAEGNYLKKGEDWKPYSVYNIESANPYAFNFKREEYAK
jgi:hypothetical protein